MTAYFDAMGERFAQIERTFDWHSQASWDALEAWELELVRDVTLAAESPGMPADIREAIHDCVLRYGVRSLPVNHRGNDWPDGNEQWHLLSSLGNLSSSLHDIFHELCRKHLDGFSDDPRMPMRVLFSKGEEFREQRVVGTKHELPLAIPPHPDVPVNQ